MFSAYSPAIEIGSRVRGGGCDGLGRGNEPVSCESDYSQLIDSRSTETILCYPSRTKRLGLDHLRIRRWHAQGNSNPAHRSLAPKIVKDMLFAECPVGAQNDVGKWDHIDPLTVTTATREATASIVVQ